MKAHEDGCVAGVLRVTSLAAGAGGAIMVIYRMLSSGVFDPDAVKAMTAAYERACTALDLTNRTDPLAEVIAKIIIERAKRGELDPVRLCEGVLDDLRSKS